MRPFARGFILIEFIFALVIIGLALKLYTSYTKQFSLESSQLHTIAKIGDSQESLFSSKATQRTIMITTTQGKSCSISAHSSPPPVLTQYELISC